MQTSTLFRLLRCCCCCGYNITLQRDRLKLKEVDSRETNDKKEQQFQFIEVAHNIERMLTVAVSYELDSM